MTVTDTKTVVVKRAKVVRKPGLFLPIAVTVILGMLAIFSGQLYEMVRGPIEGEIAIKQTDGTRDGYIVGSAPGKVDIGAIPWMVATPIIVLTWVGFGVRYHRYATASVEQQNPVNA